MVTAMMQAIAAAGKAEKRKTKQHGKTTVQLPVAKPYIFEAGDKVLYWSESKSRWVNAEVLRCNSKDGAFTYDLNLKSKVLQEKVRPAPGKGETFDPSALPPPQLSTSAFANFNAFGARHCKKRGRDSDSEEQQRRARVADEAAAGPRIDWSSPPPQLLARESFGEASAFIDHFVRYFLGAWEEHDRTSSQVFSERDLAAFGGGALVEARHAIAPLLSQLARGEKLERGETRGATIKVSAKRGTSDGSHVDEAGVLEQLDRMASCAAFRDYAEAHRAYMKLTLGHKAWNNTCVTFVSANTSSGAREYRRNRDSLNTYDVDPVAQKYMQAMRKIVHFAQSIRPNDDQSKNVII
ncbi:unnamed protein product [Prorocentrum cordatum]|uniref:Uncharacterized protein n=1 Tax=Prorocentrum cordatum TaxID=2364126 RepID=A0ABN9SUK3_9DINO|nr:unnamed protein product [Polarella glacialis]